MCHRATVKVKFFHCYSPSIFFFLNIGPLIFGTTFIPFQWLKKINKSKNFINHIERKRTCQLYFMIILIIHHTLYFSVIIVSSYVFLYKLYNYLYMLLFFNHIKIYAATKEDIGSYFRKLNVSCDVTFWQVKKKKSYLLKRHQRRTFSLSLFRWQQPPSPLTWNYLEAKLPFFCKFLTQVKRSHNQKIKRKINVGRDQDFINSRNCKMSKFT